MINSVFIFCVNTDSILIYKLFLIRIFFLIFWAAPKKLYTSMVVPPAPVWAPSQWPMSVNDKNDNKVKLWAVYRSLGIYLTAQENPKNPQIGNILLKAVQSVITSNGVPPNEVHRITQHIHWYSVWQSQN